MLVLWIDTLTRERSLSLQESREVYKTSNNETYYSCRSIYFFLQRCYVYNCKAFTAAKPMKQYIECCWSYYSGSTGSLITCTALIRNIGMAVYQLLACVNGLTKLCISHRMHIPRKYANTFRLFMPSHIIARVSGDTVYAFGTCDMYGCEKSHILSSSYLFSHCVSNNRD